MGPEYNERNSGGKDRLFRRIRAGPSQQFGRRDREGLEVFISSSSQLRFWRVDVSESSVCDCYDPSHDGDESEALWLTAFDERVVGVGELVVAAACSECCDEESRP